MTLVRGKPGGFGFHDKLTSAQIETIDSQLPFALDGHAGGAYNPTSVLTVGGQGFAFAGTNHQVTGTLTVNNGAELHLATGSLFTAASGDFRGAFTFGANAGPGTNATVIVNTSSTFTVSGSTTINGALSANNSTWGLVGTVINMTSGGQFDLTSSQIQLDAASGIVNSGTLSQAAGSHLAFTSGADITGTVAMAAAMSNTGVISNSGAGHYNLRPAFQMTDADATKGVNDCDTVFVQDTVFTANHSLTVTSTGAVSGSRMRVYMNHQANTLTLKQDNASTITTLKNAVGFYVWVDLEHNGSANGWFLIGGWSR